ncbi:MAG: exodeoxyribonuclease VII large subunit [Candidatus Omnitrophota bacterium]
MVNDQVKIYSVSEITRSVRVLLEDAYRDVWVEGEVSNFRLHTSGHMYFVLKDAASVLRCAMFRGANQRLKFTIDNGMKVVCFGSVSVYEPRGEYQLIVRDLEPKGLGALQLAFQQLKERLLKEGLFDESRKRVIPMLPYRIGVVTSPTGAAIRDIMNVAKRRFSNIEIIINPAQVQGAQASAEIAKAVGEFNEWNRTLPADRKVDCLIVGRGGGSLEDLWAFNEEVVARAIAASEIPVISAVGHEIDHCISDFVADKRAPTPSAAAEMILPRKEELVETIKILSRRMKNAVVSKIDLLGERLLALKSTYALRQPVNLLRQYQQRVDELGRNLFRAVGHLLETNNECVKRLSGKLDVLSPTAILKRGYSITMDLSTGRIVRDAGSLEAGNEVRTLLGKGAFVGRVEKVER